MASQQHTCNFLLRDSLTQRCLDGRKTGVVHFSKAERKIPGPAADLQLRAFCYLTLALP
jgi:hypothetical protein